MEEADGFGFEGGLEGGEAVGIVEEADDGAAGAGEFGGDPAGAGGLDHVGVAFADVVEAGAEVEVFVEEGVHGLGGKDGGCIGGGWGEGGEEFAELLGEFGPASDGVEDGGFTAIVAVMRVSGRRTAKGVLSGTAWRPQRTASPRPFISVCST